MRCTTSSSGTAAADAGTELVGAALDADIAWFDTANSYSDGRFEEIIGRVLKGRNDVTIATKAGHPHTLVGTENLLSGAPGRTVGSARRQPGRAPA